MGYSTECIIESLEVEYSSGGLEDVIISVKGVLSGNYNGSHIHETGPLEFKVPAPDPSSYIAFASLKQSDVINFICANFVNVSSTPGFLVRNTVQL